MGVVPLDRSDPLPLWAQLERELQRRIDHGDFADGNFPTDLELTNAYSVSRHTVREAIRQLNRGGLLRRERGRGTVLASPEFEQPLGTLYSLFDSVESTGAVQQSEVLELRITTDAEVAARLDVSPATELLYLARLRRADGAPLAVDRAWMPAAGREPLLDVDWERTALYRELAAAGAPTPTRGWERLTPVVAPATDAGLLGLDTGEAVFYLERFGCTGDQAIEWRTTTIRGDRYRFIADWGPGASPELRPSQIQPDD